MVKTFDILLDLEKDLYNSSSLLFTVSRNDLNTIQLNFVITQDGAPIDLTDKTVELAVKKPSGLTVYQTCEITSAIEGKANVILSQQAYIEFGIYTAEVYIRDINNLEVTFPFWYQSRTTIFNETTEEAIQSSNDWSALQEALFAYDLKPYLTDGYPIITPEYIGQIALDNTNGIAYIATALTSNSWVVFGGGGSDTIFGDNPLNFTPARIGQLFIDEINKNAYISLGVTPNDWEQIDNEDFVQKAITWGEILNKPTAFTPEIHTHDYIDIQDKPLTFPPEAHGHEIIEVIGLQDALDLKADDSDLLAKANSADVYTKLETYNKNEVNTLVDGAETVVENNLTSISIDTALSANQGRILNTTKADINHNHDTAYSSINHNHDTEYAPLILPNDIVLNATSLTNAVQLNWEVGTATSWAIWRSEVKNTLGTKLADSIITNTYTDSTALGGTTYYYTLQIEDVSQKTISDQVEATPYSITVFGSKRVEFAGYAGWTVYGSVEATADFGNEFTVQGGDRLKIDTSERLRFELPIGMVGSSDTGGIIKANIAGKTDYTIEYGIRFDSGFPWSKGGKVPGFSGGAGYTGGAPAWDGDGFSVRLMWREGGRIIPYVYHYNQPDEFGDTFGETLGYFTDTQEHIIKYYAVLNTGANPDGILKIYLDGVQVFDKRDLIYRIDESLIDTAHIAIFAGGSGADWNMTGTGYIRLNYFDWA